MTFIKTLVQHPRATAVLLLAVVLIILMGIFLQKRLDTLQEGATWVEHSQTVRFELSQTLQSMLDLGSGVNAYQFNRDPDVFAPAERATAAIATQLASLNTLVGNDRAERPLFDALVLLANRRVFQTRELRERARAGDVAAVQNSLVNGEARSLMLAARSVVAQFEAQEQRALENHRRNAATAYEMAMVTIDAVAAGAILLLFFVTVATLRDAERLREVQEEMATTLRSIGDAVISTDAHGAVRFMNQIAEQLTGTIWSVSRGRPLKEVFRIVNERTRAAVESPVDKVLAKGAVVNLANHTLLISRDGTERPIEDSGAPIRNNAGELVGVVLVFRDATFERRAQSALQQSDARFKAAVDAVAGVIWTNNAAGEMRGEQSAWAKLTGQSYDDYQGFGWSLAVHPDDAQPTIDAWLTAVKERRLFVFEHRVRRRDGEWRRFSVRAIPLLDPNGGILEWVGVHTDITDQRMAEDALRVRERQFVGFADAMPHLAWTERPDGSHEYFNRGWFAYTGLSEAASLRRDGWRTVIHPEDLQRATAGWNKARTTGIPYDIELRLRHADGLYRWFLVRAVPDTDASGAVLQWVGTCTDIDKAKKTQAVLQETEAALRTVDARKDDFLATLSHELRNPLAPIRSAARLLASADADPDQRKLGIAIIGRQVGHMASLLDDLMDVARITRGVLQLKPAVTNLRSVLEMAIESARPALDERDHRLIVEWPDASITISVDPVRFTQVITNLLTNAAKYTNGYGEITIGARRTDAELGVFVRDTGIGISQPMLAQIFNMFAQVQPATERSAGGLGIGLGLAKALVELHGGHIEAFSAGIDCGSEFTVYLPARFLGTTPSAQSESGNATARSRQHTVLIADDNRDAAESLGMLLEMSGHSVALAHSGTEAIAVADARRPTVLILDIGMPGMNGYEVATEIRKSPWANKATLIAVTGWGQEDDKRKAVAAGFNHHLTKPVDSDVLERLIAQAEPTMDA